MNKLFKHGVIMTAEKTKKEVIDLNAPQAERIIGVDCGTMNLVLS